MLILSLFFALFSAHAQDLNQESLAAKIAKFENAMNHWSQRINFRGYTQIRYNRLLETNDQLKCDQCDKSLGENGGFFVRRARFILFGELNNKVFFYIQPDLASASGSTQHYGQLRDLYFDIALSKDKTHRVRFGQSKVPFGFENLQSSSNRLALDRNDGLNSAVANERDLGATYYWAPVEIRKRLADLTRNNLKGTGDYGVFGLGVYNGQTANQPEKNNNLHVVSRLTYPFKLSNGQIIEPSIQAYHGKYVTNENIEFDDRRQAVSLMIYPMPLGFQAEYNVGVGPEFDVEANRVRTNDLKGGYVQIMYNHQFGSEYLVPFIKYQTYKGGKKHEASSPYYDVTEYDFGVEWQPDPSFELTAIYSIADRKVFQATDLSDESGSRIRLQLQINY